MMTNSGNQSTLQQAADASVVRRSVRASGVGATVFGLLALFGGLVPPMSPVLLGIGGALSVSGLWNLTNPSPIGIAIASACLAAVGLYNIASTFLVAANGGHATALWAVLGTWQIIWAVQGYRRYQRFANAHEQNVSDSDRQAADRMLAALQRAKLKDNPDVIEFIARAVTATRVRARLMPDGALCVIGADQDVRVASRAEFDVQVQGGARSGRASRVRVSVGGRVLDGTMSEESLARFQNWKREAAAPLRQAA